VQCLRLIANDVMHGLLVAVCRLHAFADFSDKRCYFLLFALAACKIINALHYKAQSESNSTS